MSVGASVSQLRRGVVPHAVLALLDGQERYGVELVRELAGGAAPLALTEGTLYPLLGRLRRDGLVETTWQESPSGPPRRYYRLTEAGTRQLAAFRAEWDAFRDAVDLLLSTTNRKEHP